MKTVFRLAAAGLLSATIAVAADNTARPDSHAPMGVMADHYHRAGEWMFSYRYMNMAMEGNRDGTNSISPESIATTAANPLFGNPMQPPTLRVVPTQMAMEMHMVGVMYAPTDWLTLALMGSYVRKDMDHITFAGPTGENRRGGFTTRVNGVGDTRFSTLLRLHENAQWRLHAQLGVSLPTGDIDHTDDVLAPTGMRPTLRLPYPMQLGSGSYDPLLGLTAVRFFDRWSIGAQWSSVLRVADNDDDYRLGDEDTVTAWVGRRLATGFSLSGRLSAYDRGNISGRDALIAAPVQTADPNRQAIRRLDLGVGLNWAGADDLRGHRMALELTAPVYQDLDGPQLETDWTATLGYQFAL